MYTTQIGNILIIGLPEEVFKAATSFAKSNIPRMTPMEVYELAADFEREGITVHDILTTWVLSWVKIQKQNG